MGMYDDIVEGISENIEIMGVPFFAENIDGDEPYNRRELIRKQILNGTEIVKRGKYVPRKYNFRTVLYHETGKPDAHDSILAEIMSKPVEVISPYMGGKFMAEVTFRKNIEEASPNHIVLTVDIEEIPDKNSLIPGETQLVVPTVKKVPLSKTRNSNSTSNSNSKIDSTTNKKLNDALKKCNVPFKKGQKNSCIKTLQEKLILLGYLDKKNKTSRYDTKTIEAVKAYQKSTKTLTVDGIFGKYTLKSLLKT